MTWQLQLCILQIDAEDMKYMTKMYGIMQQRKMCSITLKMLLVNGGFFEEFQNKTQMSYLTLISSILPDVLICRFDAVSEKLQCQWHMWMKEKILNLWVLKKYCIYGKLGFITIPLLNFSVQAAFEGFNSPPAQPIIQVCVVSHRKWWGMRFRWWTSSTMSTSFSFMLPLSHAMTSSWWWSSEYMNPFGLRGFSLCICAGQLTVCLLQCGGRWAVWPHHRRELQPDGDGHGSVHSPDLWGVAVHAQDVYPPSGPQGEVLLSVKTHYTGIGHFLFNVVWTHSKPNAKSLHVFIGHRHTH